MTSPRMRRGTVGEAAPGLGAEVSRTLQLATPLVLGQLAAVGINFVDAVMVGRVGPAALAAVAVGGAYWTAVLLFVIGVLMTVPPHVAQLAGAGRAGEAGALFRQAAYIAVGLAILFMLALRYAGLVLNLVGVDAEIVVPAVGYLEAMTWGVPAMCGYLLLRFLGEGLSIAKPAMYFGFLGLAVNVPANYALIFGHFGLPRLEAVGCGYASSFSQWCSLLAMLVYVGRSSGFQRVKPFQRFEWPHWPSIRELLWVGLPIGAAVFVEGSLFATVAFLMGSLGVTTAAAHQAAINFSSLVFMVPLGISMAITIRVGNAVGRSDWSGARRAARVGFAIVLITQLISASIMLVFPGWIATLYSDDPAVKALVLNLLVLAAIFQLPDGLQVAGAGALRGLKDTRIPMMYTLLAYWCVGIPAGYGLGIGLDYGAEGIWIGLIAGLTLAALLNVGRFLRISRVMAGAGPEKQIQ